MIELIHESDTLSSLLAATKSLEGRKEEVSRRPLGQVDVGRPGFLPSRQSL
ncbi:hypothetical protein ALQ86_200058 [Pseudomonas amygdali pv. eriobotryae]|uniref:Uncharacterized protein n=1 Tax=Pseudomonas amygdali pv. eriobotryae TaxID=129137 RepID=A0A3M3APT0_PSEA0|nr:hypothetical protein ALQ86_200058 [Pseudomonas amygdali pv. eriobotryae]